MPLKRLERIPVRSNRRYLAAVALLAVLAVAFGVFGTVAPPLAEEVKPSESSSSSSSSSVAHFANPPTYDSGWVDIRDKTGQYFNMEHNLNTTDAVVDITGKQGLYPWVGGGSVAWSRTYGSVKGNDYAQSVVQTNDGGYALGGYLSYGPGGFDACLIKTDSAGNRQWNKTYGGTGYDISFSVIQTSDGGYAIAGYTASYGVGGDMWLVKTDSTGTMLWNKTYGGPNAEYGFSVIETSGGGYALVGSTKSYGDGTPSYRNLWVVKTDASGNKVWNKTYGGTSEDYAFSLVQASDGGYAIAGLTYSLGVGTPTHSNLWLVKIDAAGNHQWNKTYGGTGDDYAYSLVKTSDGGYAIAGGTNSSTSGYDFWLVKTNADGNHQWNKTYGGMSDDYAYSMVQASDGGYAIAGATRSFGVGTPAYNNFYLVRTDSAGYMVWGNITYGGPKNDYAYSVVQTSDEGFAVAGETGSYSWYLHSWLVKLKPEMNIEHQKYLGLDVVPGWSKIYGIGKEEHWYEQPEEARSVIQTSDGGFALAGYTRSYGAGNDFWLVRTDGFGNKLWSRAYGGIDSEIAYSVAQTIDGGYALAGRKDVSPGISPLAWLVKTDADGNMLWNKTFTRNNGGVAYSLIQTDDGGYALAGYAKYNEPPFRDDTDFWLIKTDYNGNTMWNKTYGAEALGYSFDLAHSIVQTSDGGYALAGSATAYNVEGDMWLGKTDAAGNMLWNKTYAQATYNSGAYSLTQTIDDGYAVAGYSRRWVVYPTYSDSHAWLVKTDSDGNAQWNRTYGETYTLLYGGLHWSYANSIIQTDDEGYALAGAAFGDPQSTQGDSSGDFWLLKVDSTGNMLWSKKYGGASQDCAYSMVQTGDGGYALAGFINSSVVGSYGLVKTDTEIGLARTGLTNRTITLYRGKTDPYWNYVRVRIWTIKEPSWMYGDLNMDGIVDAKDLYIMGRNYGKTFSLLSLTGIIAVAGIHTVKKRKQPTQPNYIS